MTAYRRPSQRAAFARNAQMQIDALKRDEIEALLRKAYNTPKPVVIQAAKLVP